MTKLPITVGSVVVSTAGRDEGRTFLVVEELDENYVPYGIRASNKNDESKYIILPISGKINKAAPGAPGSSGAPWIWSSTKSSPTASHNVYGVQVGSTAAATSVKTTQEYNAVPVRPVRDSQ